MADAQKWTIAGLKFCQMKTKAGHSVRNPPQKPPFEGVSVLPCPKLRPLMRPKMCPRPPQIQIAGRTGQADCQKVCFVPSKDVGSKTSSFEPRITMQARTKEKTS